MNIYKKEEVKKMENEKDDSAVIIRKTTKGPGKDEETDSFIGNPVIPAISLTVETGGVKGYIIVGRI